MEPTAPESADGSIKPHSDESVRKDDSAATVDPAITRESGSIETRHATAEDLKKVEDETKSVYSQLMDTMIADRVTKGQYFGVFGIKDESTGEDSRMIVLNEPGTFNGSNGMVALTPDGPVMIINDLNGQNRMLIGAVRTAIKEQINSFYSGKSVSDEYQAGFDKAGYKKSPWGQNSLYFGGIMVGGTEQDMYKDIRTLGGGNPVVTMESDISAVQDALKINQEKAESPFSKKLEAAQQQKSNADSLLGFVQALPPKT